MRSQGVESARVREKEGEREREKLFAQSLGNIWRKFNTFPLKNRFKNRSEKFEAFIIDEKKEEEKANIYIIYPFVLDLCVHNSLAYMRGYVIRTNCLSKSDRSSIKQTYLRLNAARESIRCAASISASVCLLSPNDRLIKRVCVWVPFIAIAPVHGIYLVRFAPLMGQPGDESCETKSQHV